jgi:hypothetical protein
MLDLLAFQGKLLDSQGVAKWLVRDFVSRVHARSPARGFAAAGLQGDLASSFSREESAHLSKVELSFLYHYLMQIGKGCNARGPRRES